MARNNHPTISIDEVSQKFEKHLQLKGNSRIILSGRYGTGKSFFLKNFFEARKQNYNTIAISPAKYVVSSNEDIFELIKVDIIIQLFTSQYLTPKKRVSDFRKVSVEWFIHDKPAHFIKFIASYLSKIDKSASTPTLINGILSLNEQYKKYVKEVEDKLKIKEEQLQDFVNTFIETTGNIFEQDFITQTITGVLEEIKGSGKDKKENVLIIDDLDRIDPEHIFRILNILSAHNDYWWSENKFGFDKIIIVCDIDNIRNIYEHKYGKDVDFNGYMDKFYTTDYFRYDNRDAIKVFLSTKDELGFDEDEIEFLSLFLEFFLNNQTLTLRQVIKSFNLIDIQNFLVEEVKSEPRFIGRYNSFIDFEGVSFYSQNIPFLKTLRLLISVFGDLSLFKKCLRDNKDSSVPLNMEKRLNALCILAIPYLLATEKGYAKCFKKTGDMNRNIITIDRNALDPMKYPQIDLLGFRFDISLSWRPNNLYRGNSCYLEGAKVFSELQNANASQYSHFFRTLSQIVSYLENQGALSKMGVGANV